MPKAKCEDVFRRFVEDFGGDIVPEEAEDSERSADYFFCQYNVVAELKCLVVDRTAATYNKLSEIIEQRRRKEPGPSERPNPYDVLFPFIGAEDEKFTIPFDKTFQQTWGRVLLMPFENIIRDANRQIRATKERLCIPSAYGVVLIFNEGNLLHATAPQYFVLLAGQAIQKPQSGERRFPHIQGLVYFSFGTVQTFDEQCLAQKPKPFGSSLTWRLSENQGSDKRTARISQCGTSTMAAQASRRTARYARKSAWTRGSANTPIWTR
jgi:hypothetical protein